jgi:hypothetical protein
MCYCDTTTANSTFRSHRNPVDGEILDYRTAAVRHGLWWRSGGAPVEVEEFARERLVVPPFFPATQNEGLS